MQLKKNNAQESNGECWREDWRHFGTERRPPPDTMRGEEGWNDREIHTEEEKKRAPDKNGGKGQPPLQVMS